MKTQGIRQVNPISYRIIIQIHSELQIRPLLVEGWSLNDRCRSFAANPEPLSRGLIPDCNTRCLLKLLLNKSFWFRQFLPKKWPKCVFLDPWNNFFDTTCLWTNGIRSEEAQPRPFSQTDKDLCTKIAKIAIFLPFSVILEHFLGGFRPVNGTVMLVGLSTIQN